MRTLMDSSSVNALSRSAMDFAAAAPPRGKASTLVGWRGANRAPAQKAPRISTSAARKMRVRLDVLILLMPVVPSDPLDSDRTRNILIQVPAPPGLSVAW